MLWPSCLHSKTRALWWYFHDLLENDSLRLIMHKKYILLYMLLCEIFVFFGSMSLFLSLFTLLFSDICLQLHQQCALDSASHYHFPGLFVCLFVCHPLGLCVSVLLTRLFGSALLQETRLQLFTTALPVLVPYFLLLHSLLNSMFEKWTWTYFPIFPAVLAHTPST